MPPRLYERISSKPHQYAAGYLFTIYNPYTFIMKKNLLYALTCLAFAVIIGAAVYEHINVVPTWSAAPPFSMSMFQGQYGLKPELFWMIIHPVNLLLFTITLILHWKSQRKINIITVLAGYFLILVITSIYFVPELIKITTAEFSESISNDLTRRASLWETLSLLRLSVLVVLSIVLFTGLTKPGEPDFNDGHKLKRRMKGKLSAQL
jgi:cytochrome bd-type quinol oxidase subunit 2